jgi:hypothetical protein
VQAIARFAFLTAAGFFWPTEVAHQLVVPGLQPALGLDRRPGGLHEHRLDVGPGAGPAMRAFVGADVVARAQGDSGGKLLVAGEVLMRGWADLGQPRLARHVAEPGDRFQQVQLTLVWGGLDGDLGLQAGDCRAEQRDPVQVQPASGAAGPSFIPTGASRSGACISCM